MSETLNNNDSAESRLRDLGIQLPEPGSPFGAYVEAVQTGNLLFLSGMLPTEGHSPKFVGKLGKDLTLEQGRSALTLAAMNALAVAREHLGTLDRVTRVIRLGVYLAATDDFKEHPKVADAASELFRDVFGSGKTSVRQVIGVSTLPFGMPVELEVIFEVEG
jgi:enamine deaminase RidA (YjgF/YER057c/UK114 family)